ncbi:MAG: hypothetical protein U0V73_12835 [Acidimicrobiia bacterium]
MAPAPIMWSDEVDGILRGDLTVAAAYVTPAGGAVVTGVAPCGMAERDDAALGFTTSLGLAKKLERIVRNPKVALAYHSREHGTSASPCFVLAQGTASVDLVPSPERLTAFTPQAEQHLGALKQGLVWDRLLHEYYEERVFVDIAVERLVVWPDLAAGGEPEVLGAALPPAPDSQSPPGNGTGPRVDLDRASVQLAVLPHRVLAWTGADGFPVVVPVEPAGHDAAGLHLVASRGILPPGARRAGFLAHAYRPQLVGLGTRMFTGWLTVSDDGVAVYAPHTSSGFTTPPNKTMVLTINGLMAKYGLWQARRHGLEEELRAELAARSTGPTPGP